jgi:xanthine dehydrogenase accessory factor
MKNLKSLLVASALVVIGVGCASQGLCPVSGEGLASMGGPFLVEHKGQKVKLCCEGCKEDFEKDPEKFLKIVAGEAPYPKVEE